MRNRVVIVDILTKKFKSVFYKQYDDNNGNGLRNINNKR